MAIKQDLKQVANAIRSKTGKNNLMTVSEMPAEIESIETGIEPTGTLDITANANNIDVAQYAAVNVNVPGQTPTGTKYIYNNGTHDVTNYATAQVSVGQSAISVSIKQPYINILDEGSFMPEGLCPTINLEEGATLNIEIYPESNSWFDYSCTNPFTFESEWQNTGKSSCYYTDSETGDTVVRIPLIVWNTPSASININLSGSNITIEERQSSASPEDVRTDFGDVITVCDANGNYLGYMDTSSINFISSEDC